MPTNRTWALVLAVMVTACSPDVEPTRESAVAAVAQVRDATGAGPPLSRATAPHATAQGGAAFTPAGVVVPVLGPSGDGWLVGTPCGRTATVRDIRPLTGTVVVDAGHGGEETGAVGPLGTKESDLNLAVVSYARQALLTAGIASVPTRTSDYRVAIAARAAIVSAVKPMAAVSIHHNAPFSHLRAAPGTEIFHQAVGESSAESRRLAGLLYEEVTATLARLKVTAWAATAGSGAKPRRNAAGDDFYGMLRRTQGTPTALVEVGFVSHEEEERLFAQTGVQKAVGEAVARGVVRFLMTTDPGSGFVNPSRLSDDGPRGGGTDNCQDPPLGGRHPSPGVVYFADAR